MTAAVTESTQSSLQRRAGTLKDMTVFVADRQVGGRGRGKNAWASPAGCLMFSFSFRYGGDGVTLAFVQYLVSLAVVGAVEAGAKGRLKGRVRIKWPNDIYYVGSAGGKGEGEGEGEGKDVFLKLGGVLCHSAYKSDGFYMTIGVGLNVDNALPTTCLNALVGGGEGERFSREALVAGIVGRVGGMVEVLAKEGFDGFREEYYRAWLHSGQVVRVQVDEAWRDVRIVGVAENGYLMAADERGAKFELSPDGNSLDFLQGLVAKKV